ncbi:MlaD family protein [Holophaga foetida]|uniref:MlaD family protein n=1 Tax=Holophaga foetida TaxID=35839 RepID=UPI0002474252|nr:MlaD family protein [Holophaga foetida]
MKIERDDAKIGVMVIVALLLFGGLLMYRSVSALAARETRLKVRLASASDAVVGTEVQLQGFRVGQVNSIELERHGVEYTFLATLGVQKDLLLWKGTSAVMTSKVVGGSFLELKLPPVEGRKTPLDPGEVLEATNSASLGSLIEEIQGFVRNLDQGVTELRTHLQRKGLGSLLEHPAVSRTLGNLDATLAEYRTLARDGQTVARHSEASLKVLDQDLASAQKSLVVVQELLERRSDELDSIVVNLDESLQNLRTLSSDTEQLMKTSGPEAAAAIKALNRNLKAAEELLEILKNKPSRVLWGTPSSKEQEKARKKVERPGAP